MAQPDFSLIHSLRVRWSEADLQGVVFNANYLAYLDVGITEYWRAIGYPYPDTFLARGSDVFVVKATLEFHASARYDDMLEICMRCSRLGRSSMVFRGEILREGNLVVSGELVYVNVDPATRRSAPVPEFLRTAIQDFETVEPEA
jgi:acyl-CoA thioester hydrolase